ncbi:MAG: ABC transporter permease [Acidobacteria bacterium]|nr:ABC transporter permease [Acidobacteriota bacterium]
MAGFALRRLGAAIPILLAVLTLTFFLIHLAPGDPLALYESPDIDPDARDRMRRIYGLDDPLPVQYFRWLWQFCLRGEFGVSFQAHRPVATLLAEAVPNTLLLAGVALVLGFGLGGVAGVAAARRAGSRSDHALTVLTLALYSIPGFLLAHELILVFSLWLGWLPPSHTASVGAASLPLPARLLDRIAHLILPAATLAVGPAATAARFARAAVLEVTNQDFIRTARSKGVSEPRVFGRHALRNALLPLLTLAGLSLPVLVSGSLIVEVIFSWPGMGRAIYDAVFARDYPVIIAATFLTACLVIAGSLVADLCYALADPRVRLVRNDR